MKSWENWGGMCTYGCFVGCRGSFGFLRYFAFLDFFV